MIAAMASPATRATRIWLLPLSVLGSVCVTLFVLTYLVDASSSPDPRRHASTEETFHGRMDLAALDRLARRPVAYEDRSCRSAHDASRPWPRRSGLA
jgi:hypothetical protein